MKCITKNKGIVSWRSRGGNDRQLFLDIVSPTGDKVIKNKESLKKADRRAKDFVDGFKKENYRLTPPNAQCMVVIISWRCGKSWGRALFTGDSGLKSIIEGVEEWRRTLGQKCGFDSSANTTSATADEGKESSSTSTSSNHQVFTMFDYVDVPHHGSKDKENLYAEPKEQKGTFAEKIKSRIYLCSIKKTTHRPHGNCIKEIAKQLRSSKPGEVDGLDKSLLILIMRKICLLLKNLMMARNSWKRNVSFCVQRSDM